MFLFHDECNQFIDECIVSHPGHCVFAHNFDMKFAQNCFLTRRSMKVLALVY